MLVKTERTFTKEVEKILDKKLLGSLAATIEQIISAQSISEILNLKKLVGFDVHYRVKVGNYRIGIVIIENVVVLVRFLHRKDIYKKFP
jgi:mRNA interferase RelE/StbE